MTDADVAASDDLTGSAALGGDWSLEFKTGSIEAPLAFAQQTLENYNAILPFISDIPWTSAVNGWGPVERDRSNGEMPAGDGGTLTLNGVTYSKGLGIHANSTVTYNLGGAYSRFISDVGIDDSRGSRGSVVFRVVADGVQLFDSGLMTGASATRTVDVAVSGRQNLQLIVTNGGDNIDHDHGNWAGARLVPNSRLVPNGGSDVTAPTAGLNAATLDRSQTTPYRFTVTYSDATAVNASTIDSNDIRVTGPNGYSQLARQVSITPTSNSSSITATYEITAPDGIWNWNDRGTYNFTLLSGQISDTLNNRRTSDTVLGSFAVNIASTIVLGVNSSQVIEGNTLSIPVQRLGDTTGTATIDYYTGGNSTATPNVHYVPIPISRLTFAPGETQKTITLRTLNDGVAGTNRTVSVLIEQPTGADLGPSRTSSVSIVEQISSSSVFLSDLNWVTAVNGWGPVERDRSNGGRAAGDGTVITLNGVTYSKGLGVHADSTVTYNLGGTYSRFISDVGIDDSEGSRGSVVFRVVADGVQLFDSGLMTGASATRTVDVDISGRQNLQLIVTNGGDNIDFDHGNWAGARLLRSSISPPPPPSLPPLARSSFITGLNQPTTLQWSPDGSRMYIAQKDGTVRVAVNGQLQAQPFINIADQVNNVTDRGLLGLEVDPFLGQNRGRDFVYLLYTYDPPQTRTGSGLAGQDVRGNRPARLIRVTADASTNFTTAIPGSEVILLGRNSTWEYTSRPDIDSTTAFTVLPSGIANGTTLTPPASLIEDPDTANLGRDYTSSDTNFTDNNNIRDYLAGDSASHTIGQVRFGPDGALYVTVGDGTSYNGVDPRAFRVQDIDNLSGKMLRIDPPHGARLVR